MLEVDQMNSALVEAIEPVAKKKSKGRIWLLSLGALAILGALAFRSSQGPRDASNYSMIVPTLIPGFHPGIRGMMTSFAFESDTKDAQIKGGSFRLISTIRPTNDLDSQGIANVLGNSASLPGWKKMAPEKDIVIDGLPFKVMRRNAPASMMLSAVSARGNDTYEITLIVTGSRDGQAERIESYRPRFVEFLSSIKFAQLPMQKDDGMIENH